MAEYNIRYKRGRNFLKWCEYWLQRGMMLRYSSWKNNQPSIIKLNKATEEDYKNHGPKWTMRWPFCVTFEDGFIWFVDDKQVSDFYGKGEWVAIPKENVDDLFE